MSEKQFDHIENRIREAAENSEPAFDEHAWTLMEARLDKEDNRKRPILIWWGLLVFLFTVGGGLYFFNNNNNNKNNNNPSEILTSQQVDTIISEKISVPQKSMPSANTGASIAPAGNIDQEVSLNKNTGPAEVRASQISSYKNIVARNPNDIRGKRGLKTKGKVSSNSIAGEISENPVQPTENYDNMPVTAETEMDNSTEESVAVVLQPAPEKSDSSIKNSTKLLPDSNSREKTKGKKPSRFYLLAAIGADVGSVQFLSFNNSKLTAKYGVGIGYQVNKKISIQTGFYASNKKYIAGPDDYYIKPGSYWSLVQMVKVDAACLVYDIPVTFRYNFLQKPKTGYYATVGISSYIMKEEDYTYYYLRYNMPHEAAKTYTGNKDLFSVINFSAGIEKKLSANFYIQAEPSIGIPLSGVGEGNVKLFSAALQVALKYQPVKKR